jgi:hypothetical protein
VSSPRTSSHGRVHVLLGAGGALGFSKPVTYAPECSFKGTFHPVCIRIGTCCHKNRHVQSISWIITFITTSTSRKTVVRVPNTDRDRRETQPRVNHARIQCQHEWRRRRRGRRRSPPQDRIIVTALKSKVQIDGVYEVIERTNQNRALVESVGSSLYTRVLTTLLGQGVRADRSPSEPWIDQYLLPCLLYDPIGGRMGVEVVFGFAVRQLFYTGWRVCRQEIN